MLTVKVLGSVYFADSNKSSTGYIMPFEPASTLFLI